MAEKKNKLNSKSVALSIEWHISDGIATNFATNLTVQCSEHETVISFFETKPPLLIGTPQENAAKVKELKSVRAECVARVVVATSRMPDFLEALKASHQNYLAAKKIIEAGESSNGEQA